MALQQPSDSPHADFFGSIVGGRAVGEEAFLRGDVEATVVQILVEVAGIWKRRPKAEEEKGSSGTEIGRR